MTQDPFEKLREQLELEEWPNVYFFKFIIPNNPENMARVMAMFDPNSEIQLHESENKKFVSVSVKEVMTDANSIIEIYQRAQNIPGIISL